jgi:threonine dehydrogenase-like Zn-dependent dehydrogenase
VSVSGVYGGEVDPTPLMEMFDRGVQLRMGQAHVRRWIDDLLPIVSDSSDALGVREFATHHLPPEDAPRGYNILRDKADGCIKVVLQP